MSYTNSGYKAGNRVVLVTNGGYGDIFKAGDLGTVTLVTMSGVDVAVDQYLGEQSLHFYFNEVAPAPVQMDYGLFYLIRERKDNPLKLKVMFANASSTKLFTSREAANAHKERMTRQHGDKFKFFVLEAV